MSDLVVEFDLAGTADSVGPGGGVNLPDTTELMRSANGLERRKLTGVDLLFYSHHEHDASF